MKVKKIYASSFAKLTSNVYTGGGDDDTAAIQSVWNHAPHTCGRLVRPVCRPIRGETGRRVYPDAPPSFRREYGVDLLHPDDCVSHSYGSFRCV